MAQTLEQRVAELEREIGELKQRFLAPPATKDWVSTVGWAKDDPNYEEAARLGQDYRRSQTYEKEIEARGGTGH